MIANEVSVYNLALNAIGARNNVSSPTENSREAEVCRLWFSVVRDTALNAARWPEATNIVELALLSQAAPAAYPGIQDFPAAPFYDGLVLADPDPGPGWVVGGPAPGYSFVYAMPTDCIQPQYLLTGQRFRVTGYANDQTVLMTNANPAVLSYTKQMTTISQWSSGLGMAIVYGLAANICMPLTGKPSRAQDMIRLANNYLMAGRENAANTSFEAVQAMPDWLLARGGFVDSGAGSFSYPLGELFVGLNVN